MIHDRIDHFRFEINIFNKHCKKNENISEEAFPQHFGRSCSYNHSLLVELNWVAELVSCLVSCECWGLDSQVSC